MTKEKIEMTTVKFSDGSTKRVSRRMCEYLTAKWERVKCPICGREYWKRLKSGDLPEFDPGQCDWIYCRRALGQPL